MAAAPTTRLDPADFPQLLLGRFRVLEERGQGGFGSVSVCWDPRLMRRVAIKVIPLRPAARTDAGAGAGAGAGKRAAAAAARRAAGAADAAAAPAGTASPHPFMPEYLQQRQADARMRAALAETRTASMLMHPNIVAMIDFESDDSFAYIIMEYVEGASLAEIMDSCDGGLLTFDEAAAVVEGVCDALSYAHENGVLHLDIKPDNILIDTTGRVRLADFGMASLSCATGYGGATGGTVGYMPPEQLTASAVDVRTDCFAVAAVIYEALTGARPFAAATPAESLELVYGVLADPCALNEQIPPHVADALLMSLDPDPAQRPSSAGGLGSTLRMGLGSPRAGRKSLAQLVGDILDDEKPAGPGDDPDSAWAGSSAYAPGYVAGDEELYGSSEAGVLSRSHPELLGYLLRILSGLSLGFLAALCMIVLVNAMPALDSTGAASTGVTSAADAAASVAGTPDAGSAPAPALVTPAVVIAGLAVALIGYAAPPLAGAIALIGLLAACCVRQFWLGALLVVAMMSLWWLFVARAHSHAGPVAFAGAIGARLDSSWPVLLAGYLMPVPAAALSGVCAWVMAVVLSALGGSGALGSLYPGGLAGTGASQVWAAFILLMENPAVWLTLLAWAAAPALFSAYAYHGGFIRCYLGGFCSVILLLAAQCMAEALNSGFSHAAPDAQSAAGLAAAFILISATVFLFGTPRYARAEEPGVPAGDDAGTLFAGKDL